MIDGLFSSFAMELLVYRLPPEGDILPGTETPGEIPALQKPRNSGYTSGNASCTP